MKGLIVLQRRFTPIGNEIAEELKKNHGVRDFCGYVITRRALQIIKGQQDVKYTDLLLDEDIHKQYKNEKLDLKYVKRLEVEYGLPNLWQCLEIDRTLMMDIPRRDYQISPTPRYGHEDLLRILQCYFRNTISFLGKEKPNFIVGINIGSIGTMVLYHVAKKMGIKFYTLEVGKIGNRVTFTDNYRTLSGVEKIFDDILKHNYKSPANEEARRFLNKFRENPAPPSFAVEAGGKTKLEKIISIPPKFTAISSFFIKSVIAYLKSPYKEDTTLENPIRVIINKTRRRIRGFRNLRRLYNTPDLVEDFAYFPLHFEPEITTLLYAPFYTDQLNLIRQIAKSLPVHFKLYVKEHPSMLEYRPTEYYKELKKIPNVKLINPRQSSFDLIKNSKIVITISGTAGFEAAMLGKPVVTFGDIFYNKLSFVKRCRELAELPVMIKDQLENFQYNNQEMIDFLSAIFEDTVPFDVIGTWASGSNTEASEIDQKKGFEQFVANLAKKLKENEKLHPASNSL